MANLLYQQIEMPSREKHIEPEIVVSAIEDAMVVAARKYYKTDEDLRAKFNQETGQIDVYSVQTVVEEVTDPKKEISLADAKKKNPAAEIGTEILTAKPTDVLGRIAAQTAKQVILQKVREAERDTIYNEYHNRVGELVTVIVKRAEGPDLIVDMGRTEARLRDPSGSDRAQGPGAGGHGRAHAVPGHPFQLGCASSVLGLRRAARRVHPGALQAAGHPRGAG